MGDPRLPDAGAGQVRRAVPPLYHEVTEAACDAEHARWRIETRGRDYTAEFLGVEIGQVEGMTLRVRAHPTSSTVLSVATRSSSSSSVGLW